MTSHTSELSRRNLMLGAAGAAVAFGLGTGLSPSARAAAPMLGVSRPKFYRFKLGDYEVTTILDGIVQVPDPWKIFGENQPPETVQQYAEQNLLPPARLENPFNVTLVNTGKELILFDTGNGAGRRPNAGNLLELLPVAGYQPDQVDLVVITHGHPDHINGLMEGGKPAFPNARYAVGETEHQAWKTGAGIPEGRKQNQELYARVVLPFEEKMSFLKPDGEVASGIRAVNCFGHSPGMLGFHVESGGRRLLIWGDVSNHYVLSVQKPEWHVRFDHDKDAAIATRKRIFDMVATDNIPVIGYHMPPPAVGFVEKTAQGYRWVPASYQLNL